MKRLYVKLGKKSAFTQWWSRYYTNDIKLIKIVFQPPYINLKYKYLSKIPWAFRKKVVRIFCT